MNNSVKSFLFGALGAVVVVGVMYGAGFRVTSGGGQQQIQNPQAALGQGRGTPGWRKNQGGQAGVSPTAGAGSGQGQGIAPGSGQSGGRAAAGNQPRGGGPGGGAAGRGQGPGAAAKSGAQPGFGPSGGILLPIQPGKEAVSVMMNGKEQGKFVGQDLVDHVEDTVIATADGPRKGWGVEKTLTYLGVKDPKEIVIFDKAGKKTTLTGQQIKGDEPFVLLTYDGSGSLILASGPKVRGTNKGKTTVDDVKAMVKDRKDLLGVSNVVKIEIKG